MPSFRALFTGSELFLIPMTVFSLAGVALLVLTIKEKLLEKPLKRFLLLAGSSAAGFFLSVILHNVFYALAVVTSQIAALNYLMVALHALFFIVAILVCPLGFLVGIIGTIVLLTKKKYAHGN